MSQRLSVNPIRCTAHGMCAEILPERVTLDDWGFPMISGEPVGPELTALARRAVDACPVFALKLERARAEQAPARGRAARPRARSASARR
jgi:ferredoxin